MGLVSLLVVVALLGIMYAVNLNTTVNPHAPDAPIERAHQVDAASIVSQIRGAKTRFAIEATPEQVDAFDNASEEERLRIIGSYFAIVGKHPTKKADLLQDGGDADILIGRLADEPSVSPKQPAQ